MSEELSNKLCNKFEHKFCTQRRSRSRSRVELQALKLCQQKPLIPVSRNEVKCQLGRQTGRGVAGQATWAAMADCVSGN